MSRFPRFVLSVLLVPLLLAFSGCAGTPQQRAYDVGYLGAYGAIAENERNYDDVAKLAGEIDRFLGAHAELSDVLVARFTRELIEQGVVKRRVALLLAPLITRTWDRLKPESSIVRLDDPKTKAVVESFRQGLLDAVRDARLFDLESAAGAP